MLFRSTNAPNTDKRPKDMRAALSGYFDNTYRTNPGLVAVRPAPPGGSGKRERRVIYHSDFTYQEYGQNESGDNPWQSGTIYFSADGDGCMWHSFPSNERGSVVCDSGRAAPGKKFGDYWFDGAILYEFVGHGYVPFPNTPATEGGTLGNTPVEIATNFGKLWGICKKLANGVNPAYLNEFVRSYRVFRGRQQQSMTAQLDAAFEKGAGEPLPKE